MNPKLKANKCESARPLQKEMQTVVCNHSIKAFLKARIDDLQSVVDKVETMDDELIHSILTRSMITFQHIANRLDTKMHVEIGMSKDWSDRKSEPTEEPPF